MSGYERENRNVWRPRVTAHTVISVEMSSAGISGQHRRAYYKFPEPEPLCWNCAAQDRNFELNVTSQSLCCVLQRLCCQVRRRIILLVKVDLWCRLTSPPCRAFNSLPRHCHRDLIVSPLRRPLYFLMYVLLHFWSAVFRISSYVWNKSCWFRFHCVFCMFFLLTVYVMFLIV